MILKLYYIVRKNILILSRAKGFVIGLIIAPLIITLIMGVVFSNNSLNSLRIGVIDHSSDRLSSGMISNIDRNIFDITYFDETTACNEQILKNDMHACILFDENFRLDGQKRSLLYIYADYSRINLVWQIINSVSYSLGNTSQKESMSLVRSLLDQIKNYDRGIDVNSKKIDFVVTNVGDILSKISNSSRKLDTLDLGQNISESDNLMDLSAQIDSFKDKIRSISSEQDMSKESMDDFSSLIKDNKANLSSIEVKFVNMKENLSAEKSDCIDLKSYALQKDGMYRCDGYVLGTEDYESDTSQTLYLKCRKVKNDLDENLATVHDPVQACYIINLTYDMTEEKIGYIDIQVSELDSMIGSIRKMKSDLDDSLVYVDDLRTSMTSSGEDLTSIDADLDKTKGNVEYIANNITMTTSTKSKEFDEFKSDMMLDLKNILSSITLNKKELDSISDTFSNFEMSFNDTNVSAEAITSPVDIVVKPVTENKSSFEYIAPILLAIMAAFSSILISALLSIHEKLSNSAKRNLICPTSDWLFIFGMYLTNIIVLFVEMCVFVGMLACFNAYVSVNIISLAIALFVIGSAFILTGMVIASFFNTEQSTILSALSFVLLIVFFSEVLVPAEKISPNLLFISEYNPLNMAISILRRVMLFGFDASSAIIPITTLVLYSILCFANVYALNVLNRRR